MTDDQEPQTEEEKDNPWGTLFWGVVLMAAGVGLYLYFGKLEQEGGNVRMNAIVLAVYKLAGRNGVLAVFGGLGILMSFFGVSGIIKGKQE
jgi:hypothetical protein